VGGDEGYREEVEEWIPGTREVLGGYGDEWTGWTWCEGAVDEVRPSLLLPFQLDSLLSLHPHHLECLSMSSVLLFPTPSNRFPFLQTSEIALKLR